MERIERTALRNLIHNEKYCRIFQSYIKLNGAEKHTTKHVCRINNVWQF